MQTAGSRQSWSRAALAWLVWPISALLNWLGNLGQGGLNAWQAGTYRLAVIWTALTLALRPSSWPRTVRNVFARQMLFTGVDSLAFTVRIALAVGIVVIVQSELWLQAVDQDDLSARLFLMILVRELGPLLANFVVIVRSATAIATELANMRLAGEVDVLDSQGLDPMTYLVMPRVLSVGCSVFCLGSSSCSLLLGRLRRRHIDRCHHRWLVSILRCGRVRWKLKICYFSFPKPSSPACSLARLLRSKV